VLSPGDSLSLYTDGLLEAHAPARTLTSQAMIDELRGDPPAAAREAIDTLLSLVELDEDVRDDIAILTARVIAPGATVSRLARNGIVRSSSPASYEDDPQLPERARHAL
jgi:Stage II sporulation protein E (SpoIIE)